MYLVAAVSVLLILMMVWAYVSVKQEHLVPTYNVTFQSSLQDRAGDYLYDSKGMVPNDYALEQNLLQKQSVSPFA